MNRCVFVRRWIMTAMAFGFLGLSSADAQRAVSSRVVSTVDDTDTVKITGNVHPFARAANDRGAIADSQPMTRMLLLLQRSDAQEQSLRQLLDQQQTKGSGNFHGWLTPDQFGRQFGPSDSDVQAVTDWLTSQGFQVGKVSQGRTVVEFSGNAGQVRKAFHTEIHRYSVNGEEHFANVSDPQIPTALSPVVAGVVALHNFPRQAHVKKLGVFRKDLASGQVSPMVTFGTGATPNFAVGPGDFSAIYNVPSSANGTGQTIAVVGQSNVNLQDICDFRTLFNLSPQCPAYTAANTGNLQVILNGPDPGLVPGDEGESDLDLEWAGAIAPNANIKFVVSESADTDPYIVIGGVDLSAVYIVDNNIAPILSESYGACEAGLGTTGNAFYNALWQQAAAEGITVAVSSGDSGSAECDLAVNAAIKGVAVSGITSTPYNVSVGGTDFDSSTQNNTYWNTTSGTTNSALKYMPEITWNDSACAINYPTGQCTTVASDGTDVTAGGGGPSCFVTTSSGSGCPGGYAKPPYQTANASLGIPNTTGYTTRLTPDVSFFASNGQNNVGLVTCNSDSTEQNNSPCSLSSTSAVFTLVGGTSASTPAFASVMALVNQQTGQRQGNANYVLYGLAASDTNYTSHACITANTSGTVQAPNSACIFNDIAKGNNSAACVAGSPNCSNTSNSGFGVIVYQGNAAAFTSGPGYDLATGLGSINVGNLLTKWSTFHRTASTTTIGTPSPASGTSGSTNFTIPVTVAPAPASGETVGITAYASDQATVLGAVGPFALNGGGTVSAKSNLLPPGTAYIQAYYGGDVTLGASTSSMVALSVSGANQTSKTTVGFVEFDSNGLPLTPKTGSVSVSYGSAYILQILVTPSNGTACTTSSSNTVFPPANPCPKGTVALTDNGNALNDWPIAGQVNATNMANLNGEGIAEDQPIQLAAGSHGLAAAFTSGDANFQSSTSNTLSVTITQAVTSTAVASSANPITSGQMVTLAAQVTTNSNGEAPCGITNGGTVQFTLDGTAISGSVSYTPTAASASASGTASCRATISTAISGLYPPTNSDRRFRLTPWLPLSLALVSMLFFALALKWKPQTRKHAYVYAGLLAAALTAITISGCGGGSSGGGGGGGGKNHTIGATYSGDTNYSKSTGSSTITVQ